jgi:hypothetical protein
LRANKILLSKALAELSRQTGVRVEDRRAEPDMEIGVDLKDVPFWKALDTLADTAGASVYLYHRDGGISLIKRTAMRPRVSHDGFFRCSVKKVLTSLDLETGTDVCVIFLEVAWEPELQPLFLATRPQGLRLVDDKGQVIPVPGDGGSMAPVHGRVSLISEIALPGLPRSAGSIGLLEGTLQVIAPTKMLTFTFDKLDLLEKAGPGDPERRLEQEGVTCKVSKITLAKDRWTVHVTVEYPPGNTQLDSYQSWVVNNELLLEGKEGKKTLTTRDYLLEESSNRRAVISYHFRDRDNQVRGRPEDWRLTYRTPAAIVEWPVRFSFKDVLLP